MDRVRTSAGGTRIARPAGAGTSSRMNAGAAVLSLQRRAGNAAVAALIGASRRSSGPQRQLARFAGPEHEELGNAINVKIDLGNGIVLTWGQVVAIAGDEYGTLDQLFADANDPARRFEIRAALENADVTGAIPTALPEPTAEQKKAHDTAFYMLAFDNADHFPDSGRALSAWALYHGRALAAAAGAGLANDPNGMNLAYAAEAFGQHFLTDCYSGGHIRTPRAQIIKWYVETWAPRAVPALLNSIETEMVDRLTAEADPQTHFPHAMVHTNVYDQVHDTVRQMTRKLGGDQALQRLIALGVAGALSGTIHDAEGASGVVVSSHDHPAPWIAYGDNRLGSSPVSREQAIKAVLAAKAQVDRAYVIGEEVGAEPGNENFPQRTKNRSYLRVHQELELAVRAVEPFVPRPVEERPAPQASYPPAGRAGNTPLPEWKWGNLSDTFSDAVNAYVKSEVGTKLLDALKTSADLDPQTSHGITVHPRVVVEAIVTQLMAAPLDELARRIGWPARAPKSGSGAATPPASRVPAGVPWALQSPAGSRAPRPGVCWDAMPVGVIGLGYVGLPLAVAFAEAGQSVIAVDIDEAKIAMIEAGESYIEDVDSQRLGAVSDRIEASTHFAPLARTDAVLICVPTPLTANREPDLGPLLGAAKALGAVVQSGQLIVLESTTYPGTTREQVVPHLEHRGLRAGDGLNIAFSPERIDPGRTDYTLRNTPKVVGGLTPECTERAAELYSLICDHIVRVSSPEAAEMAKLLENIFRSVNIALVNELAILADRMGLNIWEIIDAAATKPYGFMSFEPGPGMGGHCLPVDPFYLTWRARQFHMATEFIELAGKVNQQMPYYCVERIERALNDATKPVRGSHIAVLGVSYKGGVGDTRESPALRIIDVLAGRGARLTYHDGFVADLPDQGLASTPLADQLDADAIVLVTAHPGLDYPAIIEQSELFVDLRGITRDLPDSGLERL